MSRTKTTLRPGGQGKWGSETAGGVVNPSPVGPYRLWGQRSALTFWYQLIKLNINTHLLLKNKKEQNNSFFSHCSSAIIGLALLYEVLPSYSRHTPHSVALLCTRDQPDLTTLTGDKHPCPRRDSKPQYQQASGRGPTP